MKLDRLFGILSVLLEQERVQAKELAQRFEVSERTIYRDIAALEGAGMPVVTYPGTGGGIGILAGYKLDKRLLSKKDLADIGAGLAGLSSIGGDRQVKDLVAKLLPETKGQPLESDIFIDFSSWDESSFLQRRIEALRTAIGEHYRVELEYVSPSGRVKRWVEPHKIVFKANSWYLYAYCCLRQGFRLFKLNRMVEIGPPGEAFTPRPLESLSLEWGQDGYKGQGERVVLKFPPSQEYLVVDLFGRGGYEAMDDGSLVVPFHSDDMASTLYMVLSFGPYVEVLESDSLKGLLVDWAKNILHRYET